MLSVKVKKQIKKNKKNLQFGALVIDCIETSIFLKSSPIVFLFQVEIKIKENGDMIVVHDKITATDRSNSLDKIIIEITTC